MRYRLRTFITVTAASALLLGGAVPGQAIPTLTTTPEATESAQPSSYDGGDLFRGLLLGYGPVVDQHPALARGEAPSGYQVAGDQIIATIDEADPTFPGGYPKQLASVGSPGRYFPTCAYLKVSAPHRATDRSGTWPRRAAHQRDRADLNQVRPVRLRWSIRRTPPSHPGPDDYPA